MVSEDLNASFLRRDRCSVTLVQRIASMLDINPNNYGNEDVLPVGWHFAFLGGLTQRSQLRADGFPGFGVPLSEYGLPRIVLGGREVYYDKKIEIEAEFVCRSIKKKVVEKQTSNGRMMIVDILNEITVQGEAEPAIRETQTYFLLEKSKGGQKPAKEVSYISAEHVRVITPDDILLFQYSALGFNSHKIHLDRDYARNVELLPDLIVNGGLITLLVTEYLRTELGANITKLKTRHTAPLYVDRKMTITADQTKSGWMVTVYDDAGIQAVLIEVEV